MESVRPIPCRWKRNVRAADAVGRRIRGLGRAVLGGLGFTLLLAAGAGGGAGSQASEYELKAALIHKFVKYVEWPAQRFSDKSAPVVIGVFGHDPFGEILDRTLEGKKHGDRSFEILRLKDLEELGRCHILFLPEQEKGQEKRVLQATAGRGVLLVGEFEGFAAHGGAINFYIEEEKHIRFEINPEAAKDEGLTISSNLLKLARIVKDEREEG